MAEPGATNSEITASRPPYRFTPSGEPNQGDVGLWHDSYQRQRSLTHRGFQNVCRRDSLVSSDSAREGEMPAGVAITREDYTAARLRRAAAWTGRRCAIGCTATMPRDWMDCAIDLLPERDPGYRPSRDGRWQSWCGKGQIWPSMAWCAGGGPTSPA